MNRPIVPAASAAAVIAVVLSGNVRVDASPRVAEAILRPPQVAAADWTTRINADTHEAFCAAAARLSCGAGIEAVCTGRIEVRAATLASFLADPAADGASNACGAAFAQAVGEDARAEAAFAQACDHAAAAAASYKEICGKDGSQAGALADEVKALDAACHGAGKASQGDLELVARVAGWKVPATACPYPTAAALAKEEADRARAQALAEQSARDEAEASEAPQAETLSMNPVEATGRAGGAMGQPVDIESALIGGLTSFVLERAAEESEAYVLDEIAGDLCDARKAGALPAIFPSLCAVVGESRHDDAAPVSGRMLRQAVSEDLRHLPEGLSRLVARLDPARYPQKDVAACGLMLAQAMFDGERRGEAPLPLAFGAAEALAAQAGPAGSGPDAGAWEPCRAALHLDRPLARVDIDAALAALELVSGTILRADPQQLAQIAAAPGELAEDLAQDELATLPDAQVIETLVRALASPAMRLSAALAVRPGDAASAGGTAGSADERAREVVAASIALAEAWTDAVLSLERPADEAGRETLEKRRVELQASFDVATDVFEGEYPEAVTTLLTADLVPADQEPYATVLRYSTLLTDIADARSAEEVSAALEAEASPRGSYLTRRRRATWGLSGQAGLAAGGEAVLGANPDGTPVGLPAGLVLGLHLPVGFDASVPAAGGTVGVLFQLVDLGSVATARLSGNGTAAAQANVEPKIGFVQVLAPGAEVYYGLGKSPFVLSAGAAFVPAARPIQTGTATVNHDVVRFTLNLAVDVPIFME